MKYQIEENVLSGSLVPLLVLATIGILILSLAKLKHNREYTAAGRVLLPLVMAATFPLLIISAIGPALISTIGVVIRYNSGQLNLEFFKEELSSGVLALRLSTIVIAWYIIKLEIQRLADLLNPLQLSILTRAVNPFTRGVLLAETQYLFYGICAAALWKTHLDGNSSITASIAAWGLIYILDDWSIVQDYLLQQNTPPTKWIYSKIYLFNIGLLISLLIIFYSAPFWQTIVFLIIPILCILPFWIRMVCITPAQARVDA